MGKSVSVYLWLLFVSGSSFLSHIPPLYLSQIETTATLTIFDISKVFVYVEF